MQRPGDAGGCFTAEGSAQMQNAEDAKGSLDVSPGSRRAARGAAIFAVGAVVFVLAAPAVLAAAGLHPLVVHGGSMRPTLHTGDALIVRSVSAKALEIGDIVTLPLHEFGDPSVTHRLVARTRDGDQIDVVTKGDANTASERWQLRTHDSVGRLVMRVPALGNVASFLSLPLTRGALIILIFILVVTAGGTKHRAVNA
jgi:signal peptidase I